MSNRIFVLGNRSFLVLSVLGMFLALGFAPTAYSANCALGKTINLGQASLPGSLNASLTCDDGFHVGDVQVRVTEVSKWKWKADVLFSNASDLSCSVGGRIRFYAPNGRSTFGELPSSVEARPHSEKAGEAISDLTNPMYQNIDYPVRFSVQYLGFGCTPPEKKATAMQPGGDLISTIYKQEMGYDLTRQARLEGCNWHYQSTTDFDSIAGKGPIQQIEATVPFADLMGAYGHWEDLGNGPYRRHLYQVGFMVKTSDSWEDQNFYFNSQAVGDRWRQEVLKVAKACGAKLKESNQ